MVWVQRLIWVVLAVFSISVLYVVFSGGVVDDEARDRRERERAARTAPAAGSMAYDRYLPGSRQGPAVEDPASGAAGTQTGREERDAP